MNKAAVSYSNKENRLHKEEARWFVIYTKYKTEKYVLNKLRKKGIMAYVPLLKYTKRYVRKIKHFEVPLINCYVFVKITEDEYIKVLQTEYVSSFLKIRGNLLDVKDHEIEILKKIVGESEDYHLEKITFEAGRRVEVINGNLTGLNGKLIEKKSKKEFIIELDSIGYQFRMNINTAHLRVLR